jgi:hypothetical protein
MDMPTPHTACHHSGTAPTVPQIISIHFRILCYDRRPKTSFLTLIEGVTDARPARLLAGDFSTLHGILPLYGGVAETKLDAQHANRPIWEGRFHEAEQWLEPMFQARQEDSARFLCVLRNYCIPSP